MAALLLAGACNRNDASPVIEISEAWVRETVAGQISTAAYLTVANRGGADRLVGVSAGEIGEASLHRTLHKNGISRMRAAEDGLEAPANGELVLAPGGDHIMIEGLDAPLSPGSHVPLTLRFERSGERRVEAPVRSAEGRAGAGHGAH